MIVFFCYWQSVVIAILVGLKYIPTIEGWSSGEFAAAIQVQEVVIDFTE